MGNTFQNMYYNVHNKYQFDANRIQNILVKILLLGI